MTEVLRLAAFTDTPDGGNPAGVVLDASGLADEEMLAIAADLGYSETAFLVAGDQPGVFDVRYFAPAAEVPFCGHATIASAVAVAQRDGEGSLLLHTKAGDVAVETRAVDGRIVATLTSVSAFTEHVGDADVDEALGLLGWTREDLDAELPVRVGFAGARHLIVPAASRERLARLDYDFDGLRAFMEARELTTVALIFRESDEVLHARNPFPVGGVVEDPATGAAAAAVGAYLRGLGVVTPGGRFTIHQGDDMGRPSLLEVSLPAEGYQVRVTGGAVTIPE